MEVVVVTENYYLIPMAAVQKVVNVLSIEVNVA